MKRIFFESGQVFLVPAKYINCSKIWHKIRSNSSNIIQTTNLWNSFLVNILYTLPIYSKNSARKEIKILAKSNLRSSALYTLWYKRNKKTNKQKLLKYIFFIVKVHILYSNCLHSFNCLFIFLRSYARFWILIRERIWFSVTFLSNSWHFSFTVSRTIRFTMDCFPVTISPKILPNCCWRFFLKIRWPVGSILFSTSLSSELDMNKSSESFTGSSESYRWWVT